nr:sigma-70 family RNA polymerase sigma factor [Pseudoflavonifractor sp. 60]
MIARNRRWNCWCPSAAVTHSYLHGVEIKKPILCSLTDGVQYTRSHFLLLVFLKKYYAQTGDQDDLISIGTIGLIKGISTFKADKNVRLATYASRCIENEILMHFRSQRKLQGEVSLTDTLEAAGEGGTLSLMDVIAVDDHMLEDLDTRDACVRVRQCVQTCLTPRERMIITMRYGLDDRSPRTQREIAAQCGISRSYVSRRD